MYVRFRISRVVSRLLTELEQEEVGSVEIVLFLQELSSIAV